MSKGIDYGEIGALCATGKISTFPVENCDTWNPLLLSYAMYKEEQGVDVDDLLNEWGIHPWNKGWFKATLHKLKEVRG